MPRNQFQRMIFALITVIITVHAYVFYSLYVVNGNTLMAMNETSGVIEAINKQGGVYMFGTYLPIWAVVIIEFCCAYLLEVVMGSPMSFKLASKVFDITKTNPIIFETAIICATVGLMCPAMSFLAAIMYYPFAFISQLFFIQPLVRKVFKAIFSKDIKMRSKAERENDEVFAASIE